MFSLVDTECISISLNLLISSIEVEKFDSVDEIVDFLHEVIKENGLTQAEAQVLDFCWECIQFGKVCQLSSMGEIE